MTERLHVDVPELGLRLAAAAGSAHDLAALVASDAGTTPPVAAVDDAVAWLAGRRGPRRPGALRIDGRRLGHRGEAARVRAGLVVLAPPVLAAEVRVREHLAVTVRRRGTPRRDLHALLEATPHLAGRASDPVGLLSGGERQMVAWVRAALLEPRVIVLDRAGTGLDVDALTWASDLVRGWRSRGAVVVVREGRPEEAGWRSPQRPGGRAPSPHGP